MKITVYTISDCQHSKQEKEYLAAHSLPFEEKNLETNKEYLTEMLAVSNNFAGTPVTKVEMDDGKVVVLKGYTKEEFDKTLGLTDGAKIDAAAKPAESAPMPDVPAPVPPAPAADIAPAAPAMPPAMPEVPAVAAPIESPAPAMPAMPPIEMPPAPMAEPAMPAAPVNPEPVQPPAPQAPAAPAPTAPPVVPANDPSLNALLNDLQAKVNANRAAGNQPPAQAPQAPPAQPGGIPSIPEPDFKDHQ